MQCVEVAQGVHEVFDYLLELLPVEASIFWMKRDD